MKSALLSATEIIEAVEALPKDIQKEESIVALKESAKAQLKSEIGKPYTDIELPNAEDKLVALSEVVKANKVVLLDFWASWCGPCMREVPHLMKAYGDFHEKGFEIYGVSLDGDKESWMNAVQSNNFMWVNVLSLPDSEAKAPEKYGVSTIPSNFLIDSATGKIIAKNLRGEALEEELAKFFAE
jgi:peroxiredoxin